jgi:hypothetical protein
MSRTTTALKRLGVPGLAAVTMVAGLPLFLGTAQAAHIDGITIQQGTEEDAAGVCLPFVIQLDFSANESPRSEVVDVVLTEDQTDSAAVRGAQDPDFCTAAFGAFQPAAPQDTADTGASGSGDRAEFVTDANGRVVIGVTANNPGAVEIRAFYETTDNDTFDAGEFTATTVQTFTAGGPAGSNQNQNAADAIEILNQGQADTATVTVNSANDDDRIAVEGETLTYRVAVINSTDDRLAGVTVSFTRDGASPTTFGVTDNEGVARGSIAFPTEGTDEILFFVNQTDGLTSGAGPDAGEPTDDSTVTVQDNTTQQNRTLTLSPESQTITGTQRSATFTATVDDPRTTGADAETAGTLIVFGITGGSGNETVTVSNQTSGGASNECTTVDSGATNESTCTATVTDPDPVVGQTLTITSTVRGNASATDTSTLTFVNQPSDARFVDLEPETVTVEPNTAQQLTATVTDVDGNPVRNVRVRFTENGAGAFRNGNSTAFVQTDENGVATIEVISLPGETGTTTVTANISEAATGDANQCGEAANSGTDPQGNQLNSSNTGAAGVCSDSVVVTFGTASPSPSASPTTPATQSPSPGVTQSPGQVDCSVTPTVTLEDTTIIATGSAGVRVNAPANSEIELLAYSQPSTTYRVVRRALIDAAGNPAQFRVVPPTNTRMFAQIVGCDTDEVRFSKVLNVRTQLSLNVDRLGKQTYRFFGDSLPARPGGLIISLYRVTDTGRQVLTAQTRADAQDGEWVINRRFTGTGRFGFVVRTGQDLQNAPGSSNVRSLLIF